MSRNTIGSFLARMRQKHFRNQIEREIYNRLMAHLNGEKDYGYPFSSDAEIDALTETLDVESLLGAIETHTQNMPKAYGQAFRYLLHRDLHERLSMYEQVARRHLRRPCDPRFVATQLEPAQ